jgi:serine/threonine protein kinase
MGVVYEAEELASGRRVALKVLVPELSVSEEAFERFRREARVAASISDSSCVFVFGAHEVDGAPAIAMELCAGETLEHRLAQREPIPIEDALRWTIEILDGLEAAHRAGVVHRDVKPSNCFITSEGRIKVGDFGLSRSLDREVQLTRSGVFLGSPLYASPEQVRGRQVDLRSDLYSVGATLYALLTGKPPYRGENLGEVLARILSESPEPPSRLRKEIPRGLDKVILRAMSREPERRFQSHPELREALREFLQKSSGPAGPLRRFIAYQVDVYLLSLLNLPIIALWKEFDPNAIQLFADQPWRPYSNGLMLTLPAVAFVYFACAEGFFSRTIGKWITGERVVLVGSSTHGVLLRMLRAAVWSTLSVLSTVGILIGGSATWVQIAFGWGIVPLAATLAMLSTMRRRNGWRGVHELVSRTRVVAEPLPFARFVRQKAPPASHLERPDRMPARLGTYATVGRVGRTTSGEFFEASDTGLDRRVWVHLRDPGAPELASERRSLERATRLRWLDGFEERGRRHDVFEAPGGARFLDCCASGGRLSWPVSHGVLSALAQELEGNPPVRISLEQLWIDRSWSLRILDEPLGESVSPERAPLELLSLAASTSFGASSASGMELPPDLPEHAERTVRRLLGLEAPFTSVAEARRSLSEFANRLQGLTWKIRGRQLLLGSGVWILFCGICLISTRLLVIPQARKLVNSEVVLKELGSGRRMTAADLERSAAPTGAEIDADGLRARSILVADFQGRLNTSAAPGVTLELLDLSEEEEALVGRVKEQYGRATSAEIDAARATVESERPPDFDIDNEPGMRRFARMHFVLPLGFSVVWAATAMLSALLVRGGFSLRMTSLAVRDAKGRRAGRLRCVWRALLGALPFLAIYLVPLALMAKEHLAAATVSLVAAVAVHALLVAASLRTPARGWQDRLARTRLVPR